MSNNSTERIIELLYHLIPPGADGPASTRDLHSFLVGHLSGLMEALDAQLATRREVSEAVMARFQQWLEKGAGSRMDGYPSEWQEIIDQIETMLPNTGTKD